MGFFFQQPIIYSVDVEETAVEPYEISRMIQKMKPTPHWSCYNNAE